MIKKCIFYIVGLLVVQQTLFAQDASKKVTDNPNISIIGNFNAEMPQNGKSTFQVEEMEFSFQHYLYPSVKADVFVALHKEDGETHMELEEGFVTFTDLVGVLAPNSKWNPGIGAIIGKKRTGIGKVNPLHPEQLPYIDRPLPLLTFFGDEGLSNEGGQVNVLLPLPFFSQLEVGYWGAEASEESDSIPYTSSYVTARLWNSFEFSNQKELEFGISGLSGNPDASSDKDKQSLYGFDVTYTVPFTATKWVKTQFEAYQSNYGIDGSDRNKQTGGYLNIQYTPNKYYYLGTRFDYLGDYGSDDSQNSQWAIYAAKQLTDTAKFRLQYNLADKGGNTALAQFIFGMGPHSHVLQ